MILGWPAGYAKVELAEVDSTNAEALRRAAGGATGPLWLRADRQTAGKGRRGRPWISPPGNLFATLLIAPPKAPEQLSFAAALAASDMLAGLAPQVEIAVKWPNDVLADGAKIVGILLEATPQSAALAIGIGINLTGHPADTPYRATSLRALGVAPPSAADALLRLSAAFAKWYAVWMSQGFAPLREAWLARVRGLGGPISVRLAQETRAGTFEGVDEDGALLLSRRGATLRITAGDVFFP